MERYTTTINGNNIEVFDRVLDTTYRGTLFIGSNGKTYAQANNGHDLTMISKHGKY